MKKGIVLSLFAVLSALTFSVSAQEKKDSGTDVDNLFGNENKNKYADNWFISVAGSANLLWAEQDELLSRSDRITYGGTVDLGKWFNPNLGMRLRGLYGSLRGYNYLPSDHVAENHGWFVMPKGDPITRRMFPYGFRGDGFENPPSYADFDQYIKKPGIDWADSRYWPNFKRPQNWVPGHGDFLQEFNYASLNIDVMLNLTNLMRGRYREDGKGFNIIGFVGGGYIRAFANGTTTPDYGGVVFEGGMRIAYSFNPNWAMFVEPQANLTFAEFDGYIGTRSVDAIFNFSAGVQYTFNRNFDSPTQGGLSPDEINYLNDKINNNRSLIDKHQQILERQQDLLDRLNKCCEEGGEREVITRVLSGKYLPEYIRFTLNSAKIQASEDSKLKDASEFLKSNPDSKLLLIGYADKMTGSANYNLGLSRKRAEAVADELKRRGVDPGRLILEWRGDKEQPYGPNDWNRVVIMVER